MRIHAMESRDSLSCRAHTMSVAETKEERENVEKRRRIPYISGGLCEYIRMQTPEKGRESGKRGRKKRRAQKQCRRKDTNVRENAGK